MIEAAASGHEVLVEQVSDVLVVTMNRPAQRNAVNLAVAEGIASAFARLDADPAVAVAVLTGAGGAFCSGRDIKALARSEPAVVPGRGFAGFVEDPPRKPLIAAVEGWALGGGFEIVLACDLVVASESAQFGLPEVRRGLAARGGGAIRLPRRVPRAVALEVLLTGAPLTAERAARLGLVNRVVPDGQALAAALDLARAITANAPLAVRATKRVAVESADWPEAEAFARQRPYFEPVFESADAREGAAAFGERRPPTWTGR